jgi:hypothetical protein
LAALLDIEASLSGVHASQWDSVRSAIELTGDFRVRIRKSFMTSFKTYLTAGAVLGAVCAPAAAQSPYPYGYQQPTPYGYQQPSPYGYQQQQQAYPGYGYNQGTGNPVTDVIDSLLGNRYNVTDRQAVRQCANAARAQAAQQYGGYNNGYGTGYRQQGYAGTNLRVTSITEVQRRGNGLRVSGTLSSASGSQYGYQNGYPNGYQDRAHSAANLSFRCNVAYNGAVTGIRIRG